MSWDDSNPLPLVPVACEPDEPYGPGGGGGSEPPVVDLRPYTREALLRIFRGGENECDELELRTVRGARSRGGLYLRIGQALVEISKGCRLMRRGFRFPDYCREIKLGRSRGYELRGFAEALEVRPILRQAVRSGKVKYRAAQEVMPVAIGPAEAYWTYRAATTTVRRAGLQRPLGRRAPHRVPLPGRPPPPALEPDRRLQVPPRRRPRAWAARHR